MKGLKGHCSLCWNFKVSELSFILQNFRNFTITKKGGCTPVVPMHCYLPLLLLHLSWVSFSSFSSFSSWNLSLVFQVLMQSPSFPFQPAKQLINISDHISPSFFCIVFQYFRKSDMNIGVKREREEGVRYLPFQQHLHLTLPFLFLLLFHLVL